MREIKREYQHKETGRLVVISSYEQEPNVFFYRCTFNPLWHGYAFSESVVRREINHLHETLLMLGFKLYKGV